jgi:dihydroorotate dehydrogenase (NAD+) catalytic subunit
MKELTDCSGNPIPVAAIATVSYCTEEAGAKPAGSVYLLKLIVQDGWGEKSAEPNPGQFYLLRSEKSGVLLGRPISVYKSSAGTEIDPLRLEFLILKKGKGTAELCSLRPGDGIQILGPLGNSFVPTAGRVCIVGGGIGVAPVAGFASTLPAKSYDFFACFKSGSYGLDHVTPNKLIITTDDGSVGVKGMVSATLTEDVLIKNKYAAVYACGPAPMLSYVQKLCKSTGTKCWLSMENKMACGVGACLGCTIRTTQGNKRCCKDGPVFDGTILNLEPPANRPVKLPPLAETESPDMSIAIAGVRFENPVIAASGTFGYGAQYKDIFDVNILGGICSKGLTLESRSGNEGVRLVETNSGLINSIGLENPGIPHFIENELPAMLRLKPVTIANLSGSSLETYVEGALLLDKTDVKMIELNISCPNVRAGGMAFGLDCTAAAGVTKAVRQATKKPLMVKLSPNAPDLIGVAMAVREAGADALSLVNTFQALSIDVETGKPVFANIRAGFSGPAVEPIALRMVYDVVQAMNKLSASDRIPVVGLGGISSWQDAVQFIMAGAAAVEVGTATFSNPMTMRNIINGISVFMKRKGYRTLEDFRGSAQ